MGMRLTVAGERMLREAIDRGGVYCAYSKHVKKTASRLVSYGYAEIRITDLGPMIFATKIGVTAIAGKKAAT